MAVKDIKITWHKGWGRKIHTLDKKRIHGPSSILNHLTDWSKIPDKVLQPAILRGSAIAEAIEMWSSGEIDPQAVLPTLCEDHRKVFQLFLDWLKDEELEIVEVERLVLNEPEWYIGYIDLIVRNKEGIEFIVEVKTRDIENYPQPYKTNLYQVVMYKMAYEQEPETWDIPKCDKAKATLLTLDSKGKSYDWKIIKGIELHHLENDVYKIIEYYNKYVKGGK